MLRLLCFLLLISFSQAVTVLDLSTCDEDGHGTMQFTVCRGLKQYEKYYFEDATGINQVTLLDDRLYRNHKYVTAYSTEDTIWIGKKLYKTEMWYRFRELKHFSN